MVDTVSGSPRPLAQSVVGGGTQPAKDARRCGCAPRSRRWRLAVGDRVDYFVRSCCSELISCILETEACSAGASAAKSSADRPIMLPVRATPIVHAPACSPSSISTGVSPILTIASSGSTFKADGVGEDHPRMRAARADVIRRDRAVGRIALRGGGRQHHLEHRARVSGRAADLDSAFANSRDGFCDSIDHGRVFHQAFELERQEIREQFSRRPPRSDRARRLCAIERRRSSK